jgi:alpha-beta hydrolase superfamily lysophospholipase
VRLAGAPNSMLFAVGQVSRRTADFEGRGGRIVVRVWEPSNARRIVLLAHGYGEHSGRYDHVGLALAGRGASVWAPDHLGHGASDGDRALVTDFEPVVDDLRHVTSMALEEHPRLPVVLVGHSMGGLIATRYAQRFREDLVGLVLSGPLIGRHEFAEQLLALPEIPDIPIDPSVLSRDPAVGDAYAGDALVYHGPFKRETLEAMRSALAAVEAGPGLGDLPTLYLHGEEDVLVPRAGTRPAVERLRGSDLTERVFEGARHEVFNETNSEEVLAAVGDFIDRVAPGDRPPSAAD